MGHTRAPEQGTGDRHRPKALRRVCSRAYMGSRSVWALHGTWALEGGGLPPGGQARGPLKCCDQLVSHSLPRLQCVHAHAQPSANVARVSRYLSAGVQSSGINAAPGCRAVDLKPLPHGEAPRCPLTRTVGDHRSLRGHPEWVPWYSGWTAPLPGLLCKARW